MAASHRDDLGVSCEKRRNQIGVATVERRPSLSCRLAKRKFEGTRRPACGGLGRRPIIRVSDEVEPALKELSMGLQWALASDPASSCCSPLTPAERGLLEMELGGLEPPASWVRSRRSSS